VRWRERGVGGGNELMPASHTARMWPEMVGGSHPGSGRGTAFNGQSYQVHDRGSHGCGLLQRPEMAAIWHESQTAEARCACV